jgi:hypothetical protein
VLLATKHSAEINCHVSSKQTLAQTMIYSSARCGSYKIRWLVRNSWSCAAWCPAGVQGRSHTQFDLLLPASFLVPAQHAVLT